MKSPAPGRTISGRPLWETNRSFSSTSFPNPTAEFFLRPKDEMDEPRLEATDRGSTVFFKRYLYSQRDPTRRPRIIAQSVPPESRCLYLAISPLLGYGLDELLERVPADSHVIALETSQELFSLCRDHVDTALFEQRRLTWVRLSTKRVCSAFSKDSDCGGSGACAG